ncbi:hypothetical protein JXVLWARM_CDS_0107 [Burkholderia phage Bm1]
MIRTIAAIAINNHDLVVVDGVKRKVTGICRNYVDEGSVDITFAGKIKMAGLPHDYKFEYLGFVQEGYFIAGK